MKVLKRIGILLLFLFSLFSALVIVCAFRPDVTDAIAEFLYSDEPRSKIITVTSGGEGQNEPDASLQVQESQGLTQEQDKEQKGELWEPGYDGQTEKAAEGLKEDIRPEYISPDQSDVLIPESVSGRNGYQRVQDEREQIEDDAASALENQLDVGYTGDGLIFDTVFYPYYGMLDEKGRHLYRQIYANANELNLSFAPVEAVQVSQLRNVFAAVYNDHPALFWMETEYYCKYRRDGRCVEIDLKFNSTAQNLEQAKTVFDESVNTILNQAYQLGSDYEKERFVHDTLLDRMTYNRGAQMNQSAYGALVEGQTVCAGYARAFQYLLQQLGIPCYYCTGYAGENHAWNIVALDDGYYNVDVTWDDTEGGRHEYFNKTDQDYADTHVRQELAVYLPPCNGQLYREQNASPDQTWSLGRGLRSIEDAGMSQADILYSLSDYYDSCYAWITALGQGSYEFSNVIEGQSLAQELDRAYRTDAYRQGYMESAMEAVFAASCEMDVKIEELAGDRYLITHMVRMR